VYRPDFKADRHPHRPDIYIIQLGFGLPRRRDTRYPRDGYSIEKNIPAGRVPFGMADGISAIR